MKNETAKFRLTMEEKKFLQREAKRLGITLSNLIRNHIAINPQSINSK